MFLEGRERRARARRGGAATVRLGAFGRARGFRGGGVGRGFGVVVVERGARDEVGHVRCGRGVFGGEGARVDGVDALGFGFREVAPVVGEEDHALARERAGVELGGDADGAVVAVVGALAGLGLDVGVPVVLVGEDEEALGGILAERAEAVVARLAPGATLLEDDAQHDHVSHRGVRQEVELVKRHVRVDDHVLVRARAQLPRRRVGAAMLGGGELAPDEDVVAEVVLAHHLHDPTALCLLYERPVGVHRHVGRRARRPLRGSGDERDAGRPGLARRRW